MLTLNEQIALSNKAREALDRIRNRQTIKSTSDVITEARTKFDYSRAVFEEFSEEAFESKVKFDAYIYNQFLKECKEDQLNVIREHLAELLNIVHDIYEHINIEPRIFGSNNVKLIKEGSEDELNSEAKRIIYEHLDKHYYKLTTAERHTKYKAYVTETARQLVINENIDIDDAVSHIYKATVIQNLIENINFPFTIKCKIEELLEDSTYKEIFDAIKLQEHWENYKTKSFDIARILSVTS